MPDAYCLFGHPVHHSWSPFIHGLFARQTGQDMAYRLYESPPAEFRHDVLDFFFDKGGHGCNVTLPHKRAAAELVNVLSFRAQRADAVNTIVRREGKLMGDNTDGAGLITDLEANLELSFDRPTILMLGAGGAARGALGSLLDLRPSRLVVANRTPERAAGLAHEFTDVGPVEGVALDDSRALAAPFDLVINATSAGLHGEILPLTAAVVGPSTVCYDMFYGVGDTPFTTWARGCNAGLVAQGWGMLVEQAAIAFELFRGIKPETAPVLEALRARAAAMTQATVPNTPA